MIMGDSQVIVSTRSRPKAAGTICLVLEAPFKCFNSQPPEGGWLITDLRYGGHAVSTRSRPKAAG